MSIASMKKMSLAGKRADRRFIISEMMRLGCIEINEPKSDDKLKKLISDGRLSKDASLAERVLSKRELVSKAIALLDRYAPVKKPMFFPKTPVREFSLFNKDSIDKALEISGELEKLAGRFESSKAEIGKIDSEESSLIPWSALEIPVEFSGGRSFKLFFGNIPVYVKLDLLQDEIKNSVVTGEICIVSSDKQQRYLYALVGNDELRVFMQILRKYGFVQRFFNGKKGTVTELLAALKNRKAETEKEKDRILSEIKRYGEQTGLLERAYDALTNEAQREDARRELLLTANLFYLEGYLPENREREAVALFERLGCAYELTVPCDDDDVPVKLDNPALIEPFGEITQMYGMPAYNSFIDPNTTMAFFYFVIFGLMFADIAYGLMVSLGCLYVLKKSKPSGTMKNMLSLFMYCGVSSVIWGAVFGSFFGNSISIISSGIFGKEVSLPILIDPINEPIKMMILSYIIGGIQILTAMFLDSLRRIKRKDYMGAVFGVYSWYLLFAGLGLMFLWSGGKYVAIAGAIAVIIGGGLGKKGFAKISGGLSSLYGISGYLSDVLSYSRLLALCLSGAVVANVVNTMGSLGGFSVTGTIIFIVVFVIGHVFNVALSILGTYVHTSRLQYIEYFGRFYEGGGRAFRPLTIKTKYVDIIREE